MSDGSLLIAGNTFKNTSKNDLVLLNLDSHGQPLWSKSYLAEQDQFAFDLIKSGTDQFIASGVTKSNKGNDDILCVKFSSIGDIIWSKYFGSQSIDMSLSLINGLDNDCLVVGRSGDYKKNLVDGVALLINNDGDLLYYEYFGGNLNDELRSAYPIGKSKYYLLGSTDSFKKTYTNILSVIWDPEKKSTPKALKVFSQGSLNFEVQTENANYFPIEYQNVHLLTGKKVRGLKVKSLSVVSSTKDLTSQRLK